MDNDNKFISCKQREQLTKYNNEILTVPKYVVQNMELEYKELEGEYDSPIDIMKKICQLQYKNMLVGDLEWVTHFEGDYYNGHLNGYFVCPKCAKADNHVSCTQCKNRKKYCDYMNESIWNNVLLDSWRREIFIGGCWVSEYRVIGKIVYKN